MEKQIENLSAIRISLFAGAKETDAVQMFIDEQDETTVGKLRYMLGLNSQYPQITTIVVSRENS